MKSHRHLFENACSFGNLVRAYRKARRGKRDRRAVLAFDLNQEDELIRLEQELRDGSYRPGGYRNFLIFDPKRRVISAAPFRDRVVHHAIVNVIEPLFERRFIADSYSCRSEKGTHMALDRFTRFARRYPYVLKGDIVQYFPSIDHDILLAMLSRVLDDDRLMNLLARILESGKDVFREEYRMVFFPGDDLFSACLPRGLPIGNLTSQFLANVYLDPLDHFVKEELRERGYIRYCDDFVVFGESREYLEGVRGRIELFLRGLRLVAHPRKTVVVPVRHGVPFLGFLVFPDHRRLLRRSVTRAGRRLRRLAEAYADGLVSLAEVRQSVQAWIGHARHGDTWGLRRKLLGETVFRRGRAHARYPHLRQGVRLEPVAVPQDRRVPEEVPALADRTP